jgi:hypothetical protein
MGYLDKALEAIQKQGGGIDFDLIETTLKEIGKDYRPGLIRWIREEPDQWTRLLALEDGINRAALSEDEIILRDALSEYRGFFEEMPRAKEATTSARI